MGDSVRLWHWCETPLYPPLRHGIIEYFEPSQSCSDYNWREDTTLAQHLIASLSSYLCVPTKWLYNGEEKYCDTKGNPLNTKFEEIVQTWTYTHQWLDAMVTLGNPYNKYVIY